MPTTQPSRSTSTKITKRPTQGAIVGSAKRPPRCGSTRGANFHAPQIARIQKATETASRTKPRSAPIKVDPSKIARIKTSAPVNIGSPPAWPPFYRSGPAAAPKPLETEKLARRSHQGGNMALRLELGGHPLR